MLFEKGIVQEARDAYRRDGMSAILAGTFNGITGPFIGFIARDRLHASVELIGLIAAAPYLGCLLAILYSHLMEGKKKMPFMVWPSLLGRGCFLFMLFATTPLSFALIVTIASMMTNMIGPAYAPIMKEVYPKRERGTIMAYIRVMMAMAMFIGTMIAGRILEHADFRYVFPVAGVIGIISSLLFATIKTKPVDSSEAEKREPVHRYFWSTFSIFKTDRNFLWFSVAIFTSGFGNLMAIPLYPIIQVDKFHITALQVAILTNATTLVWMISYPFWGRYVDSRSPIKAAIISAFFCMLIPLNYAIAHNVWAILPTAVFGGLTNAGTDLAYFNSILRFAKEGRESQYQALHTFLVGVRGAIAPFLGAGIVTLMDTQGINIRYVFIGSALLQITGIAIQIIGVKKTAEKQVDSP